MLDSAHLPDGADVRVVLLRRHVLHPVPDFPASRMAAAGLGQRRLRLLRGRIQFPLRLRRTDSLRRAARHLRRAHHRLGVRRADGRRRRPGAVRAALRPRARGIPDYSLHRLHDIRTRQRNRRSRCHALHSQMVQGTQRGLRDGRAGGSGQAGHRYRLHTVAGAGRPESPRGNLHPCGDRPPRDVRSRADSARSAALGYFRGDGRPFRPAERHLRRTRKGQGGGQVQVLRHTQAADQPALHHDSAAASGWSWTAPSG